MSESASSIDQEATRLAQAAADKKAHEAAVEKAKAEGGGEAPAEEAKPAATRTPATPK